MSLGVAAVSLLVLLQMQAEPPTDDPKIITVEASRATQSTVAVEFPNGVVVRIPAHPEETGWRDFDLDGTPDYWLRYQDDSQAYAADLIDRIDVWDLSAETPYSLITCFRLLDADISLVDACAHFIASLEIREAEAELSAAGTPALLALNNPPMPEQAEDPAVRYDNAYRLVNFAWANRNLQAARSAATASQSSTGSSDQQLNRLLAQRTRYSHAFNVDAQ